MCSGKLFHRETVYNRAGADLATCAPKYFATKDGEGGDMEMLHLTDQATSDLCPRERAGSGPYARSRLAAGSLT